jgi:hypothetical protein
VFTADLKTVKVLRADFLDFIESSQKKIHDAGAEEIYSICIDLFRVV